MFFVSLPQVYLGGIEVYPAQKEKGRRVDFEDVLYRLLRLFPLCHAEGGLLFRPPWNVYQVYPWCREVGGASE